MQPFYFKVKSHHSILNIHTSIMLRITHMVALLWISSKRTHVDISEAETLAHGPILIELFV